MKNNGQQNIMQNIFNIEQHKSYQKPGTNFNASAETSVKISIISIVFVLHTHFKIKSK
jgi:hypothetical protein